MFTERIVVSMVILGLVLLLSILVTVLNLVNFLDECSKKPKLIFVSNFVKIQSIVKIIETIVILLCLLQLNL